MGTYYRASCPKKRGRMGFTLDDLRAGSRLPARYDAAAAGPAERAKRLRTCLIPLRCPCRTPNRCSRSIWATTAVALRRRLCWKLTQWIQKEQQFWSWANQRNYGNHEQGFRQAFDQFNHALNNANQSQQYVASNPQQAQNSLESSKTQIQEALVRRKLPHSSTPLAKRIDAYRQDVGDQAASFLLAVHVPPDQGHQFQPNDLNAWRGLVDGLVDRFQPAPSAAKGKKQAADQSFEQLRVKAEELVADKTEKYDALHRSYAQLADGVQAASTAQSTQFTDAQMSAPRRLKRC
jgi:hypothetical protein